MTEFTGVHKFTIPIRAYNKFMKYYSESFDKTGIFYGMYYDYRDVEYINDTKHMVIYIETVNDEDLLKEIENLKSCMLSTKWYTMLEVTRLHHLPLIKEKLGDILAFGGKFETDDTEKYTYKYVYYIAKMFANPVEFGLRFDKLSFITESDEPINIEESKTIKELAVSNCRSKECYLCMKVALDKENYDKIAYSTIYSIEFSN